MNGPSDDLILGYASPRVPVVHARSTRLARRGAQVSAGVLAVGTALIWLVDVETVLVSGPALVVFAGLTLVFSLVAARPWIAAIAIGHLAVCGLFVALVNGLHWGPHQSSMPFGVMAAIWTGLAVPWTTIVARRSVASPG